MLWPMYVLAFVGAAGVSASDVFLYSRHSCDDLVPRHPLAIEKADTMLTNHVQQPTPTKKADTEDTNATTTSTTTTTTTTQPPPPEATAYTGNAEIKVMTSEDSYRRLKSLRVTLQSSTYFNGFMLQARKVAKGAGGKVEVVGRFLQMHHRAKFLSCPNGSAPENTVIHEDAPLRLANLTFVWMAPEMDLGDIQFVASILLDGGMKYKIFRSEPLKLNIYPVSTKDCAVVKSCFRYCTGYSGSSCQAHTARYTAAMEFTAAKTRVKFTLGGQLASDDGYLAIGFSRDGHQMTNADISVCYRSAEGDVGVEHYLLDNIDYMPDLHLAELQLESSDVDGDYVWCTFSRQIKGKDNAVLDLSEPTYYFYFWGRRNGTAIYLPEARYLKRSDMRISLDDELFNEIVYGNAPRHAPYISIVAAAILIVSLHFLW
ncbi:uncharacterized protein LOC119580311 [Penaeus monodon]|uniref:uncharacterized protein LOC119580311 n=1 Tax=Penaeus monodon TaxID=6687 RepID=UPI0018A7AD75|nr:uncharacterized protein LOC119580311 [Penaeus monodon]